MFWQTLGALAVVLLVIFASYYATRYLAGRVNGGFRETRYLKVLDRFSLSKDKMLVLCAMGGRAYLICVTNHGMELIDQKDLEELEPLKEKTGALSDSVSGAGAFMKEYLMSRFVKKQKNGDSGASFSDFWEKARRSADGKNPD